jgi:hypothetical protein
MKLLLVAVSALTPMVAIAWTTHVYLSPSSGMAMTASPARAAAWPTLRFPRMFGSLARSVNDFFYPPRTAQCIEIMLPIMDTGENTCLPAADGIKRTLGGSTSGESGKLFDSREDYLVIKTSTGKYAVHVHYQFYIYATKSKTVFDDTLPVLPMPLKPEGDEKDYVKVGPEIKTAAYFTGGTITY